MRRGPVATALALAACGASSVQPPRDDLRPAPPIALSAPDAAVDVARDAPPAPDAPSPDAGDAAVISRADAPHAGELLRVLSREVAVYFEPRVDDAWSGSLRAGAELRVRRGPLGDERCPPFEGRPDTGWYELEPGGYVCVSRGAVLLRHLARAVRAQRPRQPRRDVAMPYPYAQVVAETMLYRAPPTEDDERYAEPERFTEDDAPASAEPLPPRTLEDLAGFDGTPMLRRVTRGMFLSLDRAEVAPTGERFWRTHSAGWVRAGALRHVGTPALRGVTLGGDARLPLVFVTAEHAARYTHDTRGRLRHRGHAARWSAWSVTGDDVTLDGEVYVSVHDALLRRRDVHEVRAHEAPEGLNPGERWIDVNLDHQSVVAYEGATPVFATLMSSGIPSQRGPSYETVQGAFRIEQKHLTTTMDGNSAAGAYSIEDVPWVMYFHESFALHGAFWHDGFGAVRSHGCVNLSPNDARWLFLWSAPALPEGWHSVHAADDDPGTRVYVHYDRQRLGESGGPVEVPGH